MVKTRSQTMQEEEDEIPTKYFKAEDGDLEKNEEEDLQKVLKESLDEMLANQGPSTSGTSAQDVAVKKEPTSLKKLFHSLKSQGFSLPRFHKSLEKVVQVVESDQVDGSMMVLLYLHHHNPDSQKFAENVFTDKEVLDIIRDNFVVWAADLSNEEENERVEEEVECVLGLHVVELLRQYQVENYPLLMVVMMLEGEDQVMKVFTGVKDIPTLCQELTETILTCKSIREEQEGVEKTDMTATTSAPVLIELQVGPCLHSVQFSPQQQLQDLLQYVACRTGLQVGQFSLTSGPGTDLTRLWDTITLQQVGMQGGTRVRLRIVRK